MAGGTLTLVNESKRQRRKRLRRTHKKQDAHIKNIAKQVVQEDTEIKWTGAYETNVAMVDFTNASGQVSGIDLMQNLQQGTGYDDTNGTYYFTGLSVNVLGIDIKGHISMPAIDNEVVNYDGLGCINRLMVVIDNQASNNTILQLYNSTSAQDNLILYNNQIESQCWNSPPFKSLNRAKKQERRFTVLYDKTIRLSLDGGAPPMHSFHIRKRFPKGLKFQYYPSLSGDGYYNKRIYFIYTTQNNQGYSSVTVSRITYTSLLWFNDGQ